MRLLSVGGPCIVKRRNALVEEWFPLKVVEAEPPISKNCMSV